MSDESAYCMIPLTEQLNATCSVSLPVVLRTASHNNPDTRRT